ncbi:family 10 glycosylhydrolase [Spirulina subsalsa FACHB-351]|uniref:Family 10 glycosylhydrolase n=1 Tax=Spirulina subsalsa FACHB-351 TaxID=234711 RepID=A0ABT3L8E8_9CYAN|nr:family 10 glycosylhydrolase [Spirulina subsalsa]MCW6037769.1 family 10 glycosylhydrolase [Spirulina subsalsa FACHB-351]
MTKSKQKKGGCGCCSIPISVLILGLGLGIWGWTKLHDLGVPQAMLGYIAQQVPLDDFLPDFIPLETSSSPPVVNASPSPPITSPSVIPSPAAITPPTSPQQRQQNLRGIYISRYQITNNASEQMIRERVRYYRSKGINTIIHGVWGNACTMYPSEVMANTFNARSCPNQFQDQWLDWLIDEAHKQGIEVHAYFEKGIKIDEDSPLFDLAVQRRWIVAGVDRTHPGVDHYVLDVTVPEVAQYMTDILVEFVQKYPQIDAVQWDDYLGYHAELPGQVDRTEKLTNFVQNMIHAMKKANPNVSFDIAHHNPYWAKQYFAADWENWDIDRAFIQVYAEENFQDEMKYVEASNGIAITERQFNQLEGLVKNPRVESILLFPLSGKPEEMAATYYDLMQGF